MHHRERHVVDDAALVSERWSQVRLRHGPAFHAGLSRPLWSAPYRALLAHQRAAFRRALEAAAPCYAPSERATGL